MIFLLVLIPATMLTVAGYAVFYLAHRSEGNLKAFGRILGFWAFTLAALLVLAGLFMAAHCGRMHCMMMHGYPAQMMPSQEWPKPWGYLPPGNPPPPAAPGAQPAPPTPPPKPAS
jgi:hypothetical protein